MKWWLVSWLRNARHIRLWLWHYLMTQIGINRLIIQWHRLYITEWARDVIGWPNLVFLTMNFVIQVLQYRYAILTTNMEPPVKAMNLQINLQIAITDKETNKRIVQILIIFTKIGLVILEKSMLLILVASTLIWDYGKIPINIMQDAIRLNVFTLVLE